jgi:short-subunit dehydrogenase
MTTYRDKVAVITGAGSGIGRALAIAMAGEGARLALSDIRAEGLEATMKLLPTGVVARAYHLDVAAPEAVVAHAADVTRDFGTAHLLFNNAGATLMGTFEHALIDEMEWLLRTNLWGVIGCTKAFLPMMLAQKEGCIVNISSVFGLIGFPAQSAYNISKFGVRGLTESLWSELEGTGVRAVCVHPGGIKTMIAVNARICRNAGAYEARLAPLAEKELLTPPERCAAAIVAGVKSGKKRIVTGHRSQVVYWMARLLPDRYPALLRLLGA